MSASRTSNRRRIRTVGQGGNEGGAREAQLPGRRVTMEAPNHCGGAEWLRESQIVPTMSQVLSSIQYICFRMT